MAITALWSTKVEKHVLGGLIQSPELITDVDRFITDKDFVGEPHGVIYSCLRSSYLNNEKIDKVLLSQKIKNLGISFKDDINIFDYIDALSYTTITKGAAIEACQELSKLRALREMNQVCEKMKSIIEKSTSKPLQETIAEIDKIYGDKINSFEFENEPTLLFDDILEQVEERGNNPVVQIGLETPFPEFNRLYGGLRNKNLYIFVSRAKSGKSSLLNELSSKISVTENIPVLILDTEMSSEEVKFRAGAAKSGVGLWYLETGNWRKDKNAIDKVRNSLSEIKGKCKVYHISVGNKSIEEIASICRRWYLRVVGRGNKCLICYDYIKMIDKLSKNQQEYQLMGDKVDMLKKLAEELNCPIIAASQANRSGVTTNKNASEIQDDEGSIGISDRITWYATYVGILRRKTPDEIALDTPEFGTHKLIEIVSRFQGKDAAGHIDYIPRPNPDGSVRYVKNYINLEFNNFSVVEKGSLKDCIARQKNLCKIEDTKEQKLEQDLL